MPSSPVSHAKHTGINELHHAVVREVEPAYFDEEDDPDSDNVEEGEVPLALSVRERAMTKPLSRNGATEWRKEGTFRRPGEGGG